MTLVLESPGNYICRSWKVLGKSSPLKVAYVHVQYAVTSLLHASLFTLTVVSVLELFNVRCLALKFTFLHYESVVEK